MTSTTAPMDTDGTKDALRGALAPLAGSTLLVGLDVDGTLVNHDGDMSAAVHDTLQDVARTHHAVIATGRSIHATLPVVRTAGIESGFAVASNGAVTVELDRDAPGGYRVIDAQVFRPESALRTLREVAPGAHYAVEMADGSIYSTGGFQDASFGVEAQQRPLDELITLEAVRVVVHVPDLDPTEFSQLIEESGIHGVTYAIGWTAWLDMAAPGISKASALESVRARLGVAPEHTLTMGDGWNDVEMLDWARVGIAMGQAPDGVAAHADARTLDVHQDGAAVVLGMLGR